MIPNLLTLTNLFLGCIASIYIFNSELSIAAYLVFAAVIIDFTDGFVARLLNAQSALGKQLDSLADMVTFGFVPGLMLFQLLRETAEISEYTSYYSSLAYLAGFSITIFSALRLAKFNINESQQDAFTGLPTPATALFIVSLPLVFEAKFFFQYPIFNYLEQLILALFILNNYFLYAIIILFSYLLIAPIRMFSLKFKNYSWTGNQIRYIFLAISFILIVTLSFIAIPVIIILYILFSVTKIIINKQ